MGCVGPSNCNTQVFKNEPHGSFPGCLGNPPVPGKPPPRSATIHTAPESSLYRTSDFDFNHVILTGRPFLSTTALHIALDRVSRLAMECPPPAPPATVPDDQEILDNMGARMHGPMSGFMKKYFGNSRHVHQDAALEIPTAAGVIGRFAVPPATPSPENFLQWFLEYVSREHHGSRGAWNACSNDGTPEQESGDDSARLLLTIPTSPTADGQVRWDAVQVVGQFHQDHVCYQDGLVHLCRSAYQVFASQPTRLFLHGFYIRSSLVELWVFDRSGLYCSDILDFEKDFIQFLTVILSYQRMTDQDLGKIDIIEADENGSYIMLDGEAVPSLGKLYLESQPRASREGLVGTGMTFYRARRPHSDRWDYIVKFKWRWARDRPEDELLRLAKERCVWGTVSLDFYKELESTANLRRGLRWGVHRRFARMDLREQRQDVACNTGGLVDHSEETNSFFQNRILACIVTSPVGRPLHTFRSIVELLEVFRDAIKCHRSLYHGAEILHQDVSLGNIIVLDSQDGKSPKGILIDLDSAIELSQRTETEPDITGTRPFMAISVLKSEPHTYRHDMESFLYVFIWTIIASHGEDLPETSKLRQWSKGDWHGLAARKVLDMDQDNFQKILEEFKPEFHSLKPVAESLRQILFPLHNETSRTESDGSPEGADTLYDKMICTFEEAIVSENER